MRQSPRDLSSVHCRQSTSTCPVESVCDDTQELFDHFHAPAVHFGLTVGLKKTEVMFHSTAARPVIKAGDTTSKAVGSILSMDALVDDYNSTRLSKASSAFGRLSRHLWNDCGIRLDNKVAVYKAWHTLPWCAAEEIQGHAEAQSGGTLYRSEGT